MTIFRLGEVPARSSPGGLDAEDDLFVPGVDDFVERTFQGFVGRAAR